MATQMLSAEVMELALKFRAMNTGIELTIFTDEVEKATAATQRVEELFQKNEDVLSRFRPNSELSKLNRAGYLENASDLLYKNVAAACRMREFTGGIFDPTMLDALEAAGYDRSFELISKGYPQLFTLHQMDNLGRWQPDTRRSVELDLARKSIKLAPGVRIDLGGIAKGTTVDEAAELLRQEGFENFMVSAGGDMYVEGCPPQDERGWKVLIDDPNDPAAEPVGLLLVANKAVATSASTGRSWYLGQQRFHHLIDPRTHQPSASLIASATVVAPTVQIADVMAKVALILGPAQTIENHLKEKAGLTTITFVSLEGEIIEL